MGVAPPEDFRPRGSREVERLRARLEESADLPAFERLSVLLVEEIVSDYVVRSGDPDVFGVPDPAELLEVLDRAEVLRQHSPDSDACAAIRFALGCAHAELFGIHQRGDRDLAIAHLAFAADRSGDPVHRAGCRLEVARLLIGRYSARLSDDGTEADADLTMTVELLTDVLHTPEAFDLHPEARGLLALAATDLADNLLGGDPQLPGRIEQALAALDGALADASDPLERAELQALGALQLHRRHALALPTAEAADLDRVIESLTAAAEAGIADGRALWVLGIAMTERFEDDRIDADRDAAIQFFGAALDRAELADWAVTDCQAIRGRLLLLRYEIAESPADLRDGLTDLRLAREGLTIGDGEWSATALCLAVAIGYGMTDNPGPAEVSELIDVLREVLESLPEHDADRFGFLLEVTTAVATRACRGQRWNVELDGLIDTLIRAEPSLQDDATRFQADLLIGNLRGLRFVVTAFNAAADLADAEDAVERIRRCIEHPLITSSPYDAASCLSVLGVIHLSRIYVFTGWRPSFGIGANVGEVAWAGSVHQHPDFAVATQYFEQARARGHADDHLFLMMCRFGAAAELLTSAEISDAELSQRIAELENEDLARHPLVADVNAMFHAVYLYERADRTRQPADVDRAVEVASWSAVNAATSDAYRAVALLRRGAALLLRHEVCPSAADAMDCVLAFCDAAEVERALNWELAEIGEGLHKAVEAAMPYRPARELFDRVIAATSSAPDQPALSLEQRLRRLSVLKIAQDAQALAPSSLDDPDAAPLSSRAHAELGRAALEAYRRGAPAAPSDTTDLLETAVDHLSRSRLRLGDYQPTARTADVLADLAQSYALRGEVAAAIEAGLGAMQEYAQAVLLASTPAAGLTIAQGAAVQVERLVALCLAQSQAALAIIVLEAGRGLVLHAATISADVSTVLQARDPELAQAWQSIPSGSDSGPVSLITIRRSAAGVKLLMPVLVDEIGPALWNGELDALVYLVAGTDGPGTAILFRHDETIEHITLPELRAAPDGPLDRARAAYRKAFLAGELDPAGIDLAHPAVADWQAALTELTDWAHQVAVGPILEQVGQWQLSRTPRLTLIPTGVLGHVPWHAARRPGPDGARYACQDAVFSYAASARQLIDVTRRTQQPLTRAAVFVANPTRTQVWPSICAEAARSTFYPEAAYLGYPRRLSNGRAGSPEEVLRHLPSADHDGASMLQLSSHANMGESPTESFFVLAEGEHLRLEEILQRARGRRPDAPGGLVICDSCMTDVAETDHDEVLTLGTAFVAAGAVGVIGARWPLDDALTAVMMYALHHRLSLGLRPAEALRATQLWMLDPRRVPPPGMPAELLGELDRPELADVAAWAAFTHQGR